VAQRNTKEREKSEGKGGAIEKSKGKGREYRDLDKRGI